MSTTYSPCPSCNTLNRIQLQTAARSTPVCSRCKSKLSLHGSVSEVSGEGLAILFKSSPLPVVADFWAEWCGPCKMFAPIFSEAARDMAGEFVFAKVDTEANQQTAAAFAIQSIPTLLVFFKGSERARHSGAMLLAPLKNWLRSGAGA